MVKQYVGARYVPKFATPVEWAADTSYEALTIVTFNNASYTSKVPVPPTVGNPANNPQYWALTGNYNAQVEQYRQETENYNAQVKQYRQEVVQTKTELNNKITSSLTQSKNYTDGQITTLKSNVDGSINELQEKINNIDTADEYIIISDSYGETRDGTSWITILSGLLGTNKCHSAYQGGYGFAPAYDPNNSFSKLLKGISGISDRSKIKKIIVAGGFNDRLQTTDKIITAIKEFTQYAKTTYPNAVVLIAGVGWSFNSEYVQELNLGHYLEAYKRCGECGASYIIGSENILHNKDLFYEGPNTSGLTLGHEYVHPNASGSKMIAGAIYGAITGNNGCSVHFDPIDINLVPAAGVTITTATFKQSQDNNLIVLNLFQSIFQIPRTAFNYSANAVELATITNGFIAGGSNVGFGINTSGFVAGGTATGNQQVPIRLVIRGNKLYAYALAEVTATALCFYDTTTIYSVVEA